MAAEAGAGTDRVVLLTGATGGLGPAVCRAFAAEGTRLALTARSRARLDALAAELALPPERLVLLPADLADPASVEALAASTVERFGRIDVLLNLAGGFYAGTPVHETPLEVWQQQFDLNARSVYLTARAVVPHMLRQGGGVIVNVSSRAALHGDARAGIYSASKAVVVRLTESMAAELRDRGVRVNCVLPSIIDTPANRQAMPRADTSRWVSPEALADVIRFLASDAARAIHGAAIPVYARA